MKYRYNKAFHELWTTDLEQSLPGRVFSVKDGEKTGIENLMIIRNQNNISSSAIILPDLCAHLVIHLCENNCIRYRLIGPRTSSVFLNRRRRSKTFICRFRPQSLRRMIGLPLNELTDRSIEAAAILGDRTIAKLEEGLLRQDDRCVLETLVAASERVKQPVHGQPRLLSAFLAEIERAGDQPQVGKIARTLGVSDRYLRKICLAQLGMPPKKVLKIKRFTSSLLYRQHDPVGSWAQVAASSGYFDQSHMIEEYQEFIGLSPTQTME